MYGEASASLRRWSRCLWAANASALRRSASSAFMVREAFEDEEHRSDGDRRVRHVERGPVPAGGMQVEEVDHLAIAEAVDQVAERSAEDERESGAEEPPSRRAHDQRAEDADGDHREADEQRRLPACRIGEEAERRALVIDEHQVEEARQLEPLAVAEPAEHDRLRRLVGR